MKITRISFSNMEGMLNREEMKKVMAGSGGSICLSEGCEYYESGVGVISGVCEKNSNNACVCKGPTSSVVHEDCEL